MHFTKEEIKELGINQLSDSEIESAFLAMEGFADQFGKDWVSGHFQGIRAPSFVRHIISIWQDWSLVRQLSGAEKIVTRWRRGMHEEGVVTELFILASLLRNGAELELFPLSPPKEPDCRFRFSTEQWTYGEISQRNLSAINKKAQQAMQKIAVAAADVIPGMHGKVAIKKFPDDEEVESICNWLKTLTRLEENQFNDLAIFYAHPIGDSSDTTDRIDQILVGPHMFNVFFSTNAGKTTKKGTASIEIIDHAAKEVLETEASQLPREFPGVIFLNVSSVLKGLELWEPLIKRRLQPTINTRIGAVILFQQSLAQSGLETDGLVILNKYAARPLSEKITKSIQSFAKL